jgi:D-alanyl-D-alanine carboxypeptidase (penicillin-binding protein 5/6)
LAVPAGSENAQDSSTENADDTADTENAEDTDVSDNAESTKDLENSENIKSTGSINGLEDLETSVDTNDTEDTGETADTQDAENAEDAETATGNAITTNEIEGWPVGPDISAEGAILIEANTGTILYAKDCHGRYYPASTTKILTTLVAIENSSLDEVVDFSTDAVFSIESQSSNMGMDVGQSITMEQCLYGILVYSANEVANAVAEHVAGSMDAFVDMMNEKAASLGCLDSHFVTTNGLHDDNHYTTPYDLAQIARAFFANETLAKISGTKYYVIEPTDTQPDLIELYTHNLLTNGTYSYDGYIGGKTGYTSIAKQTLVSCAERNGMKLICVVMKDDSPNQFLDTITLFDYGFDNFDLVKISDYETNYTVTDSDFFENSSHLFGDNVHEKIMSINEEDSVILPKTVSFDELTSTLSYEDNKDDPSCVAVIDYSYQDIALGSARIELEDNENAYDFDSSETENTDEESNIFSQDNVIFINVVKIIACIVTVIIVILVLITLRSFFKDYHFSGVSRRKIRRRRSKLSYKPYKVRKKRSRKKGHLFKK